MDNRAISNQECELLDFLAEVFLQQGKSISFIKINGLPAIAVNSEEEEAEIFLKPSIEMFFSENWNHQELKVTIPVLKKEEQQTLLEKLEQAQLRNVKIYRLSQYERYSFYMKQFLKNRKTTKTASAKRSFDM